MSYTGRRYSHKNKASVRLCSRLVLAVVSNSYNEYSRLPKIVNGTKVLLLRFGLRL